MPRWERMRALVVYATGAVEHREDCMGANEWCLGGRMFKFLGFACDRNTLFDGVQIAGSDGPPNKGMRIYAENRRMVQ